MSNTKETYINLMGQHIDPSNVAALSDGIYFKMQGGEKTRMFLKGGEWSLPIAQTGNGETIYNEHDEKYDYKNVDGVWMARLKTNAPDGEWFNFDSLDPAKKQEAEQSLNTAYPDALGVVDDANKNNTNGPDTSTIVDDSKGQSQGLQLNKDNLKFISPKEGNLISGLGDTNILDLVKAIDTTYDDFQPENYYDPGSKEDYTKFSHKNTTEEGLYIDQAALEAGESTGNVLKDKSQLVDQQMQTILDERHERNPNKYAKVNNFEGDLYGQTGYVNYDGKKQQGDILEERYGDASFIGWSGDRDNYTTAFDYLKEDADGNQQPVDFPLTQMGPQTEEATMTEKPRDPLVLLNQMYGGSPHLQYGGNLPEFGWGSDLYNWGSNKASQASNYISENASGLTDGLQTGLSAVGMIPGIGNIADAANTAISGGRAAYAGYTGDTEGAKKHIAAAGVNALAMLPGIGQMATAGKIADKATDIYAGAQGIGKTTKMLTNAKNTGNIVDGAGSLITDVGEAYGKKIGNMMDSSALEGTAEMLALGKKADFTTGANAKSFAQDTIKNDTPSATDLALDDTVEVDDEQTLGAWGLETPTSTDPTYRTLKKMQFAGGTSNEQYPGYNPYSNIATQNNFQNTIFNSSALDQQAVQGQNQTIEQTEPYFTAQDELYAMNQGVQRSVDSFDAFTADMNKRIKNPMMVDIGTSTLTTPPLGSMDPQLERNVNNLQDKIYSKNARGENRVMGDGTIIKTSEEMQASGDEAIANMQKVVDRNKYQGTQENLDEYDRANKLGFEGNQSELREYEDNENKQSINRDLRKNKLDKDNPNSSGTTGDKLWNAKNKFLDSKAGQTFGKIGAGAVRIAKPLNRLLEQKEERKRLKTIQNNAYLSDNMFATTDADLSGSKGDDDINTGIFRAEDKITTRQGRYGTELTNTLYKAQSGWWDGVKNTALSMAENLTPIGQTYQLANYAKDIYDGESLSNVGNTILDDTQTKLGYAGNIIGPGDFADGANSLISMGRGYFANDADTQAQHYKNAAISAESIINPVLGAASTLDNASGGVTSLTDYAGAAPNIANYAINQGANTQSSSPTFADNDQPGSSSRGNRLRRGGSFFNDGGEAEIDINMYKELIAAGADLEII